MFNVNGTEIIIILVLALIVLGPNRLPEAIRSIGKFVAQARRVTTDVQNEMKATLDEAGVDLQGTVQTLRGELDETAETLRTGFDAERVQADIDRQVAETGAGPADDAGDGGGDDAESTPVKPVSAGGPADVSTPSAVDRRSAAARADEAARNDDGGVRFRPTEGTRNDDGGVRFRPTEGTRSDDGEADLPPTPGPTPAADDGETPDPDDGVTFRPAAPTAADGEAPLEDRGVA